MLLSVVIPTYRRPAMLVTLLNEMRSQAAAAGGDVEVIVVDNCPDRSAAEIVAETAPEVIYISEQRPGIACARNAGIQQARGSHVIFIDDDQRPVPGWLDRYRAMAALGHAACFGPVHPEFETPPPVTLRPVLEQLFRRDPELQTGTDVTSLRAYLGTGNSMFERKKCFSAGQTFNPRFNHGGEDVWFLRELVQDQGVRLIWCAEAAVSETVPAARMEPAYICRRKYQNGQLRCRIEAGGRRPGTVLFWMAAGAAQAVGYGVAGAMRRPFERDGAVALDAKAAGGLGKLLWWWPLRS